MKLVFMGTPVYALSCLEALIGAGHEIAAVFTQPDKPKNRGKQIQMTPVKELALKHEIPVYQPLSLRKGEDAEKSLEVLKEIAPECIVVVAYGRSVTAGEHTGASEVRLHKRTRVAAADVPRSGSDTALYSVRREKIRSYHDVHGKGA